jgi:malate/lactate dehydrogenase
MRIGIIGSGGKVAKQALGYMLMNGKFSETEIVVLHSKTPNKVKGVLLDTLGAMQLRASMEQKDISLPRISLSGNYEDLKNLDVVVITSGLWPAQKEKDHFRKIDNTGRLAQSYANYHMIEEICGALAVHSPNCLVLVVANQSDMMARKAREFLSPERVIGVGGLLDTARFKLALAGGISPVNLIIHANAVQAHIVGYHNNDMCLLGDSLRVSSDIIPTDMEIEAALIQTKLAGAHISGLQKDFNYPQLNAGPTVLPGYAIYASIAALAGASPVLEGSYNVILSDANVASKYGLIQGSELSVPIYLSCGAYKLSDSYSVTNSEKVHFQDAHKRLIEDTNRLDEYYNKLAGKPAVGELISVRPAGQKPQP